MYLVLFFLFFTSANTFGMDQNNTPEYYQWIARQLLDNPHDSNDSNLLISTMTLEERLHVVGYTLYDLIYVQTNNALDEAHSELVVRSQTLAAELQAWQHSAQILYGPSSSSSQPMGAPSFNTLHRLEMEPKQKNDTFSFTNLVSTVKNTGKSWYHSLAACCLYYCSYAKKGIFSFMPYYRQPLLTLTPNNTFQPVITLVDTCYNTVADKLRITNDHARHCAIIKQFDEARNDLVRQIKATAPDKRKRFDQEYITNQLKKSSECPVCLDHFSDHFTDGKAGAECTLSCKHSLCITCFAQCQTVCPVCRKAIS